MNTTTTKKKQANKREGSNNKYCLRRYENSFKQKYENNVSFNKKKK